MESITLQIQDMPWKPNALQITQIFLWEHLRKASDICIFKDVQFFLADLLRYISTQELKWNTIIRFYHKIKFHDPCNKIRFQILKVKTQHWFFRYKKFQNKEINNLPTNIYRKPIDWGNISWYYLSLPEIVDY